MKLHTFTFTCRYGCGEIPFSKSAEETEEDAILRHYKSPIHHDHHLHFLGEPCFCGYDPFFDPALPGGFWSEFPKPSSVMAFQHKDTPESFWERMRLVHDDETLRWEDEGGTIKRHNDLSAEGPIPSEEVRGTLGGANPLEDTEPE